MPIDMNEAQSHQMIRDIGEIKGTLNTLLKLVQQNHDSTNQRINDLGRSCDRQTEAINRRIDDQQESVNLRFESLENKVESSRNKSLKVAGVTGATSGGVVLTCVEIIKALVNAGQGG